MLGVPGLLRSSGDGSAPAGANEGGEVGVVGSNSGGFSEEDRSRGEEGDRNSGGNRWPRQETMALLKIRSDMDVAFRDSSLKGPLWEEVSRKLAELGFHRSAKKCKEKFENVFKYHKRTREGRASKPDGKTYRFFDQLEALETHPSLPLVPPPPRPQTPVATAAAAMPPTNPPTVPQLTTVPSTPNPTNISHNIVTPTLNPTNPSPPPPPPTTNPTIPSSLPNMSMNSTSSSTSSDEEPEARRKRKRKWKDFFERLMREVIDKQEELQKKFIETIEKREHDRMVREEAWKMQEMARINREHEILVQERSIAAAKDAAVIAFLQKVSEQQLPVQVQDNSVRPPPAPLLPLQLPPLPVVQPPPIKTLDNGDNNYIQPSSSRWPKTEVQALIRLRTSLDVKYHDSGPKGPLWEEISAGMRKLGYNRNAKRCKEKWENINKYFKKVKESNKKRPEDAKTCPYFHQLDAIYKEKNKIDNSLLISPSYGMKPDNSMVPLMVRPEQQWPLQQEHRPESVTEDLESENVDQNHEEEEEEEEEGEEEEEDGDDEEEDEGGGGGGYEIVTNKPSSMGTVE